MTDKRDLILERLAALLQECVDDSKSFFRNTDTVPEKRRPAILMVDADEELDPRFANPPGNRPPNAAQIMALKPQTFLYLDGKPDFVDGQSTDENGVGKKLNAFRIKVLRKVLNDQTLIDLCVPGGIKYDGFMTGLASGRSLEGEAQLHLTFAYALFPSKL